jgi:murein L,D-transpeptidase YcbB/YkuD
MRAQFRNTILLAVLLLTGACRTQNITGQNVTLTVPVEKVPVKPIDLPRDGSDSLYSRLFYRESAIHFYRNRNFRAVWFDSLRHSTSSADSMMRFVRDVRYFGLLPGRYHLGELEQLKNSTRSDYLERTEVLLTDAFLRLANDLSNGVSAVNDGIDSMNINLLQNALQKSEVVLSLKSVEPGYNQYKALKNTIRTILDSADASTKDRILSGETSESEPTMKLLKSIELNLERWRLEDELSENGQYIWINIPSFMLNVVSDNIPILESKVIVGTKETPTPEFSSIVECFTIYPYWHVPRKIAIEEFLPIIQRDTSFIRRNNFDVLDRKGRVLRIDSIDWMKFNKNHFPVSLRQREGNENSLGIIKFVFDNPYAVFLHDTNAKSLFNRKVRTYSHGCIRMEKAHDLAHYLLTQKPSGRSAVLDKYLLKQERRTLNLPKRVPIHVRYLTCEVVNGNLYRYEDVYNMDKNLSRQLYQQEGTLDDMQQGK